MKYLTEMLQQYLIWNERLEIFLTCFSNILCYIGDLQLYYSTGTVLETNAGPVLVTSTG